MYKHKYKKYKSKYFNLKNAKNNSKDTILLSVKKYVINLADNCNIIAMGEATHGQEKITELRIKIFKILAKKYKFTNFVLEEQYSICEMINDWIHNKSDHELKYLMRLFMWPWRSVQMFNLINWMKKYNEKNGNILSFKGIDVQFLSPDYQKKDDISIYVEDVIKQLNDIDQRGPLSGEDPEMVGFEFRDESMFNVFMKIYDSNKKYFSYAHKGHLEKKYFIPRYKNLGYRLAKKFNDKYLVIGNSFNGIAYRGVNFKEKKLDVAKFDGKLDLSKIKIFDDMGVNYYYINVKDEEKLSDGLTIKNFDNKYIVGTGAAADSSDPYYYLLMYQIDKRFDAVIQIPNETALILTSIK